MIKYQRSLRNSVSNFHQERSQMPSSTLRRIPNSFSKFSQVPLHNNKRKLRITHKCSTNRIVNLDSTQNRKYLKGKNIQHTFERLHNQYYDEFIPCTIYLTKKKKKLPFSTCIKGQKVLLVQSQNSQGLAMENPSQRHLMPPFSTIVVSIYSKDIRVCDGTRFKEKGGEGGGKKVDKPEIQYQTIGCKGGSGPTFFQQNRFPKQGINKENSANNMEYHQNFPSTLNTKIQKLQSQISYHPTPIEISPLQSAQLSKKVLFLIDSINHGLQKSFKLSINTKQLLNKRQNGPAFDEYQLQKNILDKYTKHQGNHIEDSHHMVLIMEAHLDVLTLLNQYSQKLSQFDQQGSGQLYSLISGVFKKFLLANKHVIEFLEGRIDTNPFCLSSLTIPKEQIISYIGSKQLQGFLETNKQRMREFQEKYMQQSILISTTQNGPYTFQDNLKGELYNFLVIIEECLQSSIISAQQQHQLQQLMIQTIQIFCIITQLDGREIRKVTLPEQVINFEEYYQSSVQIIDKIIN